jgi:dihydropteroate synthase
MGFTLRWFDYVLDLDLKTHVMGILNVTPDSFSDGGQYFELNRAIEHGIAMAQDGADVIDVGGESARPYSQQMINDISALRFDPHMAAIGAEAGVPVILMHMKGTPDNMQTNPTYGELIPEIINFLKDAIERSVQAGIKKNLLIVDPGIGFGKTFDDNLKIIRELSRFEALERPILLGTSNKAFIGHILGKEAQERVTGTMATIAYGVINGAHMVRVHNVKAAVETVKVIDAIKRGRFNRTCAGL